jgi:prephenate dehydrogenase
MVATLAVVGVGLLGGSVALAARQRGLADTIIGIDTESAVREYILQTGLVDSATANLQEGVAGANVVVFCTPIDQIADQVAAASRVCQPTTLLIDVGSTKASLVRRVESQLPDPSWFVGCHPLAGSERSGAHNAKADLFQGRLVVLTPTSRTLAEAQARATTFWLRLGARIKVMSPEQHDQAVSMTSHLPHLIASALAGILPPHLVELAATGFRDTTRIAAGSPRLWTSILCDNRGATIAALDRFQAQLDSFRDALRAGDADALLALLQQGKSVRDCLQ